MNHYQHHSYAQTSKSTSSLNRYSTTASNFHQDYANGKNTGSSRANALKKYPKWFIGQPHLRLDCQSDYSISDMNYSHRSNKNLNPGQLNMLSVSSSPQKKLEENQISLKLKHNQELQDIVQRELNKVNSFLKQHEVLHQSLHE